MANPAALWHLSYSGKKIVQEEFIIQLCSKVWNKLLREFFSEMDCKGKCSVEPNQGSNRLNFFRQASQPKRRSIKSLFENAPHLRFSIANIFTPSSSPKSGGKINEGNFEDAARIFLSLFIWNKTHVKCSSYYDGNACCDKNRNWVWVRGKMTSVLSGSICGAVTSKRRMIIWRRELIWTPLNNRIEIAFGEENEQADTATVDYTLIF